MVDYSRYMSVPSINPVLDQLKEGLNIHRKRQDAENANILEANAAQALNLSGMDDYYDMRQGVIKMARSAVERGQDPKIFENIMDIQDVDEMRLALTKYALTGKEARKAILGKYGNQEQANKFQFGGSDVVQDEAGNLFYAAMSKDPSNKNVATEIAPFVAGTKPVGKLSLTSNIGLTPEQIVQHKRDIAENTKGAEFEQELKYKKLITGAVEKAKALAKQKGETFNTLSEKKATLPGIQEVIGSLRELAPVATHTVAGKLFNVMSRELGFGSTEGATARAAYLSIIRNQVLPLLKPTFGAAFTVQEGDKLEATLGDPDLGVEEKLAALDAFEAQIIRNIQNEENKLKTLDGQSIEQEEIKPIDELDPELLQYMTQEERALFK